MECELRASYSLCRAVTRRSASSFAWSFYLLPPPERRAMEGLYAYLRQTDDLVDNDRPICARRVALQQWERLLDESLRAPEATTGIWTALVDVVRRYGVPSECLFAAIEGARMDLDRASYDTFEALQQYCDRVSTSVGEACLWIWGAREYVGTPAARHCGQAIQLTNILRDVREDALRGRVYIPCEDLARFGCDPQTFGQGACDPSFLRLMEFQVERVERLFTAAEPLHALPGMGRPIVRSLMSTYRTLLRRIQRDPGAVLQSRVRVPSWQRLWIVGCESVASRWPTRTVVRRPGPSRSELS